MNWYYSVMISFISLSFLFSTRLTNVCTRVGLDSFDSVRVILNKTRSLLRTRAFFALAT